MTPTPKPTTKTKSCKKINKNQKTISVRIVRTRHTHTFVVYTPYDRSRCLAASFRICPISENVFSTTTTTTTTTTTAAVDLLLVHRLGTVKVHHLLRPTYYCRPIDRCSTPISPKAKPPGPQTELMFLFCRSLPPFPVAVFVGPPPPRRCNAR